MQTLEPTIPSHLIHTDSFPLSFSYNSGWWSSGVTAFQSLTDFSLIKIKCPVILKPLQPPEHLGFSGSLSHLSRGSLSARLSGSPPSGPLARRFFSFSSLRVMNHTCTHFFFLSLIHALTHTPLYLGQSNPGCFLPTTGHHFSPLLLLFSSPRTHLFIFPS